MAVTLTSIARFADTPAVPLVAGIPAPRARAGWEAEVEAGGRRLRLSRLDGEAGWTVDGEWASGSSWPRFWNGRGSRCTLLVPAPEQVAAVLDAAAC